MFELEKAALTALLSHLSPPQAEYVSETTIKRRASVAIVVRVHSEQYNLDNHHVAKRHEQSARVASAQDIHVAPWALSPDAHVELLYLKRASRPGDPWSGDVCFPGGHVEDGETHLAAAQRETWEECGLRLQDQHSFAVVGQLSHYAIPGRKMCVIPFVFLQLTAESPACQLQPEEICSYRWVPLRTFLHRPLVTRRQLHVSARFVPSGVVRSYMRAIGLSPLHFLCIRLPGQGSHEQDQVPFELWGLTLRMTDELLLMTLAPNKLITRPFVITSSTILNTLARFLFGDLTELPSDKPILDIRTYMSRLVWCHMALCTAVCGSAVGLVSHLWSAKSKL